MNKEDKAKELLQPREPCFEACIDIWPRDSLQFRTAWHGSKTLLYLPSRFEKCVGSISHGKSKKKFPV